jgi:hypothetical protein
LRLLKAIGLKLTDRIESQQLRTPLSSRSQSGRHEGFGNRADLDAQRQREQTPRPTWRGQ